MKVYIYIFLSLLIVLLFVSGCSNRDGKRISESTLSGDTDTEIFSKEKYHYTNEDFLDKGYIYDGLSKTDFINKLQQFFDNAKDGSQQELNIVRKTVEGDPIFTHVFYDGEKYLYYYDTTQDGFGKKEIVQNTCGLFVKEDDYTTPSGENGTIFYVDECTNTEVSNVIYFINSSK